MWRAVVAPTPSHSRLTSRLHSGRCGNNQLLNHSTATAECNRFSGIASAGNQTIMSDCVQLPQPGCVGERWSKTPTHSRLAYNPVKYEGCGLPLSPPLTRRQAVSHQPATGWSGYYCFQCRLFVCLSISTIQHSMMKLDV